VRIRPEKVAHLMRREVADILENRMRDPRLGATVTVTDVEVTHDLSFARVFVTVLGDAAARERTLEALTHAAGYVRREIGQRLELREVPEIRFLYDDSLDKGHRVEDLLRRLERGEKLPDDDGGA
jgi:ribosome-binding factor A